MEGSVYRNEVAEILVNRLDPDTFQFARGQKDPTVFRCSKTGVILIHHIDDIRAAGPTDSLARLFEKEFPKHCEIQCGELERIGTSVEVLGRKKIRAKDAILTMADPRRIAAICKALAVEACRATGRGASQVLSERRRQCHLYLPADRRDIQFSVEELARRMSAPRQCDWPAAKTLGAYLNQRQSIYRVVVLDAGIGAGDALPLETFAGSDWGGCLETRRSTDCYVITLGAVRDPDPTRTSGNQFAGR